MSWFKKHPFRREGNPPRLWLTYVLAALYTLHLGLVSYSNSTYMEQYTSPEVVGMLYTIGSALAVLTFLFFTRILQRFGNVQLTLILAAIEIGSLIILGLSTHPATTITAFVVYLIVYPLLFLNLDIFSETIIGDNEAGTGSIRGLSLTLMSIASVISPFALALIVGTDDSRLNLTYFAAAGVFALFALVIAIHFPTFKDPHYERLNILSTLGHYWNHSNLRNVFMAHFMMQMFFSWTVIYIPLYLATEMDLSWAAIGSITGVAMLAYAIFEYPIGIIADKLYGEKEMMALGFVVLAVTVSWISFMTSTTILAWMVLMFLNRIGASLVEVTTESYFFKHTDGGDANIISFFRLSRPLAFMAGSLIGSAALLYLPFNLIFIVLSILLASSIYFVIPLRDTR